MTMMLLKSDGTFYVADGAESRFKMLLATCPGAEKDILPSITTAMYPEHLRELLRDDTPMPEKLLAKFGWGAGATYSEVITEILVKGTWAYVNNEKYGQSSPYDTGEVTNEI